MYIDPATNMWLLLGGIAVFCGLTVLFIIAVVGVIVYLRYKKQKENANAKQRTAAAAARRQLSQDKPAATRTNLANQAEVVSFDDAIEISLETIKSTNIDQAVQYLAQELKQEDLNTIWVVADVLPELLVREGFSSDDANFMVGTFKDSLRGVPAMDQVFSEFPASGREMMDMGDQIDNLLIQYMEIRNMPEGEGFLAQNPILATLFADMRITTLALRQFLDHNQTDYWEVKKEVAYIREQNSQSSLGNFLNDQ